MSIQPSEEMILVSTVLESEFFSLRLQLLVALTESRLSDGLYRLSAISRKSADFHGKKFKYVKKLRDLMIGQNFQSEFFFA